MGHAPDKSTVIDPAAFQRPSERIRLDHHNPQPSSRIIEETKSLNRKPVEERKNWRDAKTFQDLLSAFDDYEKELDEVSKPLPTHPTLQ